MTMLNLDPLVLAQLKKKNLPPQLGVSVDSLTPPPLPMASAPVVPMASAPLQPPTIAPVTMDAPMPASPPNLPTGIPQGNRVEQAMLSTPPPPKSEKRKGFWGRLGDIGEAFLLSGGNPLVAGITAFNPSMLARFKDRAINEPRWQRDRKLALGEAEALDEADRREQQNQLTQAQIANIPIDNARQERALAIQEKQRQMTQMLAEAERARDNERQAATGLANQRLQLSKEGGQFIPSASQLLFGKRKPNQNEGNIIPSLDNKGYFRLPSIQQEQQRKLELERAKGEADLSLDLKKDALKTPRELDVFEEKERIRQKYETPKESPEVREEKVRNKEARTTFSKVQALINRAAKQDEEAKGIADAAKNDAKRAAAQGDWDSARREAEIAAQLYPDLIEVGGLGEGEYPFIKMKNAGGQRAGSKPSKGALSTSSGKYKAGDVVKFQGKRHRILRFEGGQAVLDPNPVQ